MLEITPQERLALGVTALLLSAGFGARMLSDADFRRDSATSIEAAAGEGQAPIGAARGLAAEERIRTQPLREGERIDPNSATLIELQRLPRVGPALAARIVAHRETNGPFRSLADFDAVPGIGPALIASLTPLLTLPASGPADIPAPSRGPPSVGSLSPPSTGDGRLHVNRATAEELEALPGVGPAIARRIVEWRTANGPFRTPSDLEKVPGIGPRLRERLEPRVYFGT